MSFFAPKEYACNCGKPTCPAPQELDAEMLRRLNELRRIVGRPLTLTSGIRCPEHNRRVGGVEGSEHTTGMGVDIFVPDSHLRDAVLKAIYRHDLFGRKGIGRTFIHVGTAPNLPQDVCWHYYPRNT